MATREAARSAIQRTLGAYQEKNQTRVAYLGDGRGRAASNLIVNENKAYVFARDEMTSQDFFPVLNQNRVRPAFNLPVVIGKDQTDPEVWQIISIHYASLDFSDDASVIGGIGPHHTQHEFGGGDEVFVDGRLFKPGLLQPTYPATMQARVLSFPYYEEEWKRFSGSLTLNFTQFVPTGACAVWVTVSLDPGTGSLTYAEGPVHGAAGAAGTYSWADYILGTLPSGSSNSFDLIPAPAATHIPIGSVLLSASTTAIDWNINDIDDVFDSRRHLTAPPRKLYERVRAIENSTGHDADMPVMGVATHGSSLDYWEVIDLGYF